MNKHVLCICVVSFIITISVYMYCSLQEGHTALIKASWKGHIQCIEELLKHGAKVDHVDKVSAVLQSIIVCLACSLL